MHPNISEAGEIDISMPYLMVCQLSCFFCGNKSFNLHVSCLSVTRKKCKLSLRSKLLSHYEEIRQDLAKNTQFFMFLDDSACHSCLFVFVPRNISEHLG